MKLKTMLAFGWLSVLLTDHSAAPEPGQIGTVLARPPVGVGSLAIGGTSEASGAFPVANGNPAEPATPPAALRFSPESTDAEIFNARVFDEPLVPSNGGSRAEENRALAAALAGYANRAVADDCSSLAAYLETFPNSRWTGPVLLHLGTEYYNYGYFSKALDSWERAWAKLQSCDYPPSKPQGDRALGELARMYSKLGRMSELGALLESSKNRDLQGPATQLIHAAKEALWMMQNKPDYSFQCGPLALDRILRTVDPSKSGSPLLQDFKSPTNGFSLSEVAGFSDQLGMHYQMAFRSRGAPVIVPAVVHWKVGHYAAIMEQQETRVLSQDYTFRGNVWMSLAALDNEASGYFLVPRGGLPAGWRSVSANEVWAVRGKGFVNGQDPNATSCYDTVCGGTGCTSCNPCGMAAYTMHVLLASLTLQDTPLHFFTPLGPEIDFTATYNHLEANQPAVFAYSNLGPKWTCNWVSYITDNPGSLSADVSLYVDGGGTLTFTGFNPTTQSFTAEAMTHALLTRLTPASYELLYPDGSRREFARSDGSVGSSRRIFLTQILDTAGNAVRINYDPQLRITNIVNAINQVTTLAYTNPTYSSVITSVTDPFGRTAYFQYNGFGLLTQITDTLGLSSQFTYGTNQFVTNLTTPYGTTTFVTGSTNGGTFLQATDPLGASEVVEYSQSSGIPHSLPASDVPHGLSTFNLFIDGRDSLFWSKKAYAEGAWDWTKAKIYHWLHQAPSGNNAARVLESEKDALDGRVWYNYAGQSTNFGAPYYLDAAYTGASDQPSVVARVLDDGTTQLSAFGYNALGNITNYTDPVGRTYSFVCATNNIDVLEARMTGNGKNESLGSATYNSQHLPLTVTDGAGQTTTITYDSRGQILSITDPKNETVSFAYDTNSFLISVQGPLAGINDTATLSYDAYNRIHTITDTEGYTITFSYDIFDRPTLKSYPDATFEQLVYDRLDLAAIRDRLGRWTTNTYNANQQLLSVRDPLGSLTLFDWCKCGLLEGISDPMGRVTSWTYDIQSRPTTKRYADGSMDAFAYETSGGRMRARTDANGQEEVIDYYADDAVKSVSYPGATNLTATVTFTYDPDYDRVLTMQDGVGTTVYTYNPITLIPSLGAGQLHSISGPLPNSMVVYQYDQLGRVVSRAINGVTQSVAYDVLSRATTAANSLGSFQYSYLNATSRLITAAYPNGQTNLYSYYNNSGDQRLKQILNLKPGGALLSSFGYAYDAVGQITSWTNQWDTLPVRVWNFSYDAVDQLVRAVRTDGIQPISTNGYAYDLSGNRTTVLASGATNSFSYNALNQIVGGDTGLTNGTSYEWDAADRLTAINRGSHRTEFTYDGLGRRARIVEKGASVVVADNRFLWCDDALCEERDSTGAAVVRRFFPQGESIIGSGTTNLFYTRDHLDSIREALDSTGTIQTRYDYDPYGRQTVLAESLTPTFGYTGHFQHKSSGLYLARERALDPNLGRWLNRDPIEEAGGLNLYAYVDNDPVKYTDPLGLCCNKSVGKTALGNYLSVNELLRVEGFLFRFQPAVKVLESGRKLASPNNLVHPLFTLPRADLLKQANLPTVKTASGALSVAGALWSTGNNVYDDYKNGAGAANTVIDGGATMTASLLVSANPVTGAANLVTGGAASALVGNGINGVLVGGKTLASSRVTSREQAAIKKMFTRNWATAALWRAGEWLAGTDDEPACPKTACRRK